MMVNYSVTALYGVLQQKQTPILNLSLSQNLNLNPSQNFPAPTSL